jgi:hypothetical protein
LANLEAVLWGNVAWANDTDWGGAGSIVAGTVNVCSDPAFVGCDVADPHIGPGRTAVDAGADADVRADIDGDLRPTGTGYDIGTDEYYRSATLVVTDTAESGPGSLHQALLDAQSGDTITFDTTVFPPSNPMTIVLTSALPDISQGDLTIDASDAGVILDGSGIGQSTMLLLDDVSLAFDGGANQLLNGDFPTDINHWSYWDDDPGVSRSLNNSEGNTAAGSLQIDVPPRGNSRTFYDTLPQTANLGNGAYNSDSSIWIAATPGTEVSLSWWQKGSAGATAFILYQRDNGDWNNLAIVDAGASDTWQQHTVTDVVPGDGVAVGVQFDVFDDQRRTRGLQITSNGNTIQGLQIINFPFDGILILDANDNVIGGDRSLGDGPLGQGNLISGNGGHGIQICGDSANNEVVGNRIGTDLSGTSSMPNAYSGIALQCSPGPHDNVIGGTTSDTHNLISGNAQNGVRFSEGAHHNTVIGNYIGTDSSGATAIGNGWEGIQLGQGAHDNVIGGPTEPERNLVSGNGASGVQVWGTNTISNTLLNNWIGLDIAGNPTLGNNGSGARISDAGWNLIEGGIIGGNTGYSGGGAEIANAAATIRNTTFVSNTATWGGGLHIDSSSSATIEACQVISNTASQSGGGLRAFGEVTIEDSVFQGNSAQQGNGGAIHGQSLVVRKSRVLNNQARYGGGIDTFGSSFVRLEDVEISGNVATDHGGGLRVGGNGGITVVISNTRILTNTAPQAGGVQLWAGSIGIHDTLIRGNRAVGGSGGGVRVSRSEWENSPDLTLVNTLVVSNTSSDRGGGLWLDEWDASLINTTIANNQAASLYGGVWASPFPTQTVTITNSILWGNGDDDLECPSGCTVAYSDLEEGVWPGPGNVSEDPLFVNAAAGDYHLPLESPSVDAGTVIGTPSDDFEGDPRPWGFGVDMGADEFADHVVDPGCTDFLEPQGVGAEDVQFLAAHWRRPAQPPFDCDGDGIISAADIMCATALWGQTCMAPKFGDLLRSIPAPNDGVQGLAWDGSNLWVAWGSIFKIDPVNGSVIAQIPGPAGDLQGLTWDGSTLWCVSYAEDRIYQLDPGDGSVLNSFPSPGPTPIGIAWDSTHLWNSDEDGTFYELDSSDGSIVGSAPSPFGTSTTMLDWDGQYLWASMGGRFYQLDTSNWRTLKTIAVPAAWAKGIAWDGENLWNGGYEDDTLYLLDATPAGASVAGRVLKSGAPIAGKDMYIVKNSNTSDELQVGWMPTDGGGQFSFTVDPGVEYELRGFGDMADNEFREIVRRTTPSFINPNITLPDVDIWYDGLLAPADGATFNRDQVNAGNPIPFGWSTKSGATDYGIWLRQYDDLGYVLWRSPGTVNTSAYFDGTINGGAHLPAMRYDWHVGMGLDNGWWVWSEYRLLNITSTPLTITVDGNPGDWAVAAPIATDAAGDNAGGPAGTDIGPIYSYVDDTDVYLLVEVHDPDIVYNATIELNLDYKPGNYFTHESTADLHTNIWNSGINAWAGDMDPYPITGAVVAFGEAMEIRIPRDQLENAAYATPTFVNIWTDGTGWDPSTIVP